MNKNNKIYDHVILDLIDTDNVESFRQHVENGDINVDETLTIAVAKLNKLESSKGVTYYQDSTIVSTVCYVLKNIKIYKDKCGIIEYLIKEQHEHLVDYIVLYELLAHTDRYDLADILIRKRLEDISPSDSLHDYSPSGISPSEFGST